MEHNLEELKDLDIDQFGDTTFGAYTITVQPDDDSESPREWDNLGTMVCWNSRSHLGDVNGNNEYESPEAFMEEHKDDIVLPLYVYEHSGITMNTTGYSCPWDSGQCGFIYITKEKVRNEYGCKRVSAKMVERIEGYLRNEVKSFDDYLTGNVYGFSIVRNDADGEEVDVDSCWGYLGDPEDYMFGEIKMNIEVDIRHTPAQAELF